MPGPTNGAIEVEKSSWHAHRGLAVLVRVLAFLVPFLASILAIRLVGPLLYRPSGWVGLVLWVLQAAPVGAAASILVERGTRRFLPLATLLNMSLVFPDQAPSRFSVALRTGSVRNLERRLDEIRSSGLGTTPDEAAATALELVSLLSSHDRLTRGHAERVRAYADLIAEEMGLSDSDRLHLAWGVLLHDIGKLHVPSGILNKEDKLTAQEWDVLQSHPAAGVELLEPLVGWLGEWLSATEDHHERWDGNGYPNGAAGTQISLAGRIAAVADAYDVITSKRSYKEPMSAEAARSELVSCAGTQFDPVVVRSFLAVSLGRRRTFGPLAWLNDLPIGQAGAAAAHTPVIAVTGAALAVASAMTIPAEPPEQLAFESPTTVVEAPTSTTADRIATTEEPIVAHVSTTNSTGVTITIPTSSTTIASSATTSPTTTVATSATSSTTTSTTRRTTTSKASTTSSAVQTTTTATPTTTTTAPTTSTTQASTTTSIPGGVAYNGHIYVAGTVGLSWPDAVAEAIAAGGHLVTISDNAENMFVRNTFGADGAVWVAFSDHIDESEFRWSNGEAVTFTKWMPGEPSDYGTGQDYAAIVTVDGKWDDVGDYPPELWNGSEWVPGDIGVMTVIEFDS